MTNKTLRILIADDQLSQMLNIEKQLNGLGYFRIVPVRTFHELVQLTSNPCELFDLIIVNKDLALAYGTDMAEFCRERPQVQHALFYDRATKVLDLTLESNNKLVRASLADIPDSNSLNVLMSIIDPPAQRARLELLLQPHGALSI